ncbi:MAG: FHA domain-containing protein [Bdellovibrionota bacterium]
MSNFHFYIISGPVDRKTLALDEGKYFVGRGNDSKIQLASKQISRKHAQLMVDVDKVTLVDLGSSNGTLVNGKPISTCVLSNKDQILFGDVLVEFQSQIASSNESLHPFSAQKSLYMAATKIVGTPGKSKSLWGTLFVLHVIPLLMLALVGALSFRGLLQERLAQESISRAQGLVRYLAEKNKEDLKQNNELLLDVESVIREPGVKEAFIISPKGRTLAPISKINQSSKDPFVLEALSHNSDQAIPPSPKLPNGTQIFVHPVRIYDESIGRYSIVGVAKIVFSAQEAAGELTESKRLTILFVTLALLLATLLSWISTKTINTPLTRLAEKIHQWRAGQVYQSEAPVYEDWESLYEAVERTIEEVGRG